MAFDPYESWLGITAVDRPPTYYDLLGLSPFESDAETIEQAALRRMSKVRQYQIGPQSDESQEILAELARARLVLIDPDRRADYDARLRARDERRPERSAVVKTEVIVDLVSGMAAPARDGLEIIGKLRTGDESRADTSAVAGINLSGVTTHGVGAGADGELNFLSSIAMQGSDGLQPVRSTKNKSRVLWKNRLFLVAFLGTHIAIIGGFFAFGSAIALYVRSFFSGTDPAAQAAAQGPKSPDGRPAAGPGPNPIVDNRSAPLTWLKFNRGTRITVAKSDDFAMAEHDFTIFARIKTGNSGTLFSKAAATAGWGPGAKRLSIRNGRLAFEIRGGSRIETPDRQVDDELWHDVAVTYTSQDRRLFLFIDGKPHGPQTITPTRDVTGHVIRIGSTASVVAANEIEYFTGLISEVRFYQRTLTSADIAGLPSREPGGEAPLARWTLREGGGRSVRDQTRHGHVGTLEDGAVSNASVLAANDEEALKVSAPPGPENTRPAIGNPLPDREDRGVAEVVGIVAQEEVKADNSPEGILKKHGLKAKGQLYVLETEDDVQMKVNACLLLAGRLKYYLMQKQAAKNADLRPALINQAEFMIGEYQAEMQLTDQYLKDIPRFRNGFWNIVDEARHNGLVAYKSQLQEDSRHTGVFLRDLRSQPANLQWTDRAEASAKADQKSFDQSLRESRELVNATIRKSNEVKKNQEVTKALEAVRRNAKQPIKLGPSDKFARNVRELENLEKDGWRGGRGGG